MDFSVSDELEDVTLWSVAAGPRSPASVSGPPWHHKPPVPSLSSTATGLCQHLPNNKLIWLIRNRVTQLIELLFHNSRLEKTWDKTWASHFWEWRQQSSLKKWFRPCIETDLRLCSHTPEHWPVLEDFWQEVVWLWVRRWRSCSGWGGRHLGTNYMLPF